MRLIQLHPFAQTDRSRKFVLHFHRQGSFAAAELCGERTDCIPDRLSDGLKAAVERLLCSVRLVCSERSSPLRERGSDCRLVECGR